MDGSFLFDTNILIGILNGRINKDGIEIDFSNDRLFASIFTRIELLSAPSLSSSEEGDIDTLLKNF
ncbi:MAG: hypothetical protein LBQ12_05070 [Deltaproteobacteria bacterium]|jgi:predicted nucleic acid-binding protein|nr:hypothetical protein [Deltaproteobacteria bacterium]